MFANAGVSGATPVGDTTAEAFEAVMRTNVTAVFLTMRAAVPLMGEGGAIVLNGSVMRQLGRPGSAAYSASKAAISGTARVLAAELVTRGIRVNTVIPGATRTPIWTRGERQGATLDAAEAAMKPMIPMNRLADCRRGCASGRVPRVGCFVGDYGGGDRRRWRQHGCANGRVYVRG